MIVLWAISLEAKYFAKACLPAMWGGKLHGIQI